MAANAIVDLVHRDFPVVLREHPFPLIVAANRLPGSVMDLLKQGLGDSNNSGINIRLPQPHPSIIDRQLDLFLLLVNGLACLMNSRDIRVETDDACGLLATQ